MGISVIGAHGKGGNDLSQQASTDPGSLAPNTVATRSQQRAHPKGSFALTEKEASADPSWVPLSSRSAKKLQGPPGATQYPESLETDAIRRGRSPRL